MIADNLLDALAERLGVSDGYHALNGDYIKADAVSKCSVLRGFGIDTEDEGQAAVQLDALNKVALRIVPKTIVRRQSENISLALKTPRDQPEQKVVWRVQLESGDIISGKASSIGCIEINNYLPHGYHQLELQLSADIIVSSHLIIVPDSAKITDQKLCGITVPLYGLRSARNWGVGDYEDLAVFAENAAAAGLDFVGINPVHALFPKKPALYSPYSPSSRRYLNVMLIAPDMVPELNKSRLGRGVLREILASEEYSKAHEAALVDYELVYRLKWRALRAAFQVLESSKPSNARKKAFLKFVEFEGEPLQRHVLFETIAEELACEEESAYDWTTWPQDLQNPNSQASRSFAKKHATSLRFYAFLQWLASQQLADAQKKAKAAGMKIGLYLDVAVGVVPGGAEAWGNKDEVATGVSLGAPGDAANPDGQKWNLAPLNPEALRQTGFKLLRETLEATMACAGMVRIDHILGVNRSFWAPIALNHAGAYVSYPSAELLGIIALESVRHNCCVVGENLGIVPSGFNELLDTYGLLGCTLFPFARKQDGAFYEANEYQNIQLASLGNHDFPTIRGYWEGADIEARQRLGIGASEEKIANDLYMRDRDREAILHLLDEENLLPDDIKLRGISQPFSPALNEALHRFIARTSVSAVALQLEDLLGLREQSNLPGTTDEYPNWRRKIDMPLEQIFESITVKTLVQNALEERTHVRLQTRRSA